MNLTHGTEEEHLGTLERAKKANITYIWSGDIRRNPYLAENLRFGQEKGIIEVTEVESRAQQESGFRIKWK
jgi:hypothetical protein